MIRYLSYESVVEINRRHGGPGAGVRDQGLVEGALGRPRQSFGGVDAHETVWQKAAALLHGLARTQGFHDGNKRTAWIACRVFLELDDHALRDVPAAPAHAFMLAVSADLLELDEIAEWLELHEALGGMPERHPQLDYAFLAHAATGEDNGTFSVLRGQLAGVIVYGELPTPIAVDVLCRILWLPADVDRPHHLAAEIVPEGGGEPVGGSAWDVGPPVRGGHTHHPHGLMPTIATPRLFALIDLAGRYEVRLCLDDKPLATLPFNIVVSQPLH